jgi:hypothetical protein
MIKISTEFISVLFYLTSIYRFVYNKITAGARPERKFNLKVLIGINLKMFHFPTPNNTLHPAATVSNYK